MRSEPTPTGERGVAAPDPAGSGSTGPTIPTDNGWAVVRIRSDLLSKVEAIARERATSKSRMIAELVIEGLRARELHE